MDSSSLNDETFGLYQQDLLLNNCLDTSDLKTITIFPSRGTEINATAEDLLNMSSPFGYVLSVQKIVNDGRTCGEVTYSNAEDAAVARMKLNGTKGLLVGLLHPGEVREAHENERSESPRKRPPSLLQGRLSSLPSQGLPSLLDSLYPPAHSQSVWLRICNLPEHADQRYQVLSLIPPCTTHVKVDKKEVLVTLPDISIALWFRDFLNDLYTGSRRLSVSFVREGGGACPECYGTRITRRKRHQRRHSLF